MENQTVNSEPNYTPEEQQILDDLVWVELSSPDNFLKVKETLTRIGIAAPSKKELFQSVHILHKRGRYALVHFKELFMLDGKPTNFSEDDRARRNTIANLLAEWELVKLVEPEKTQQPICPINKFTILPFRDKENWTLVPKYTLGKPRRQEAA